VIVLARQSRFALRIFILCIICSILAACAKTPLTPLAQEAYIWQQQWTPALDTSIVAAQDHFNGWRVLAFESAENGELPAFAPQLDVLAHSGRPVVIVVRLNGNRPPPSAGQLAARINEAVPKWRAAGVGVSGVEIDHDCATSQLDRYADLLANLRHVLPANLTLSITVLPTWIGNAGLTRVLAQTGGSVLQVHSILAPRMDKAESGLFNAAQARQWIDAYAALAPGDFRIALPAYGLRVEFDAAERATAVEGEMPREAAASPSRELRVDPRAVSGLLRDLQRNRPVRLTGVVWFRLPSAEDRRAWTLQTLQTVIDGAPLRASLHVRHVMNESGATDLVLANDGTADSPLPSEIIVQAGDCSAADALAEFSLERQSGGWRFFRAAGATVDDAILRAGHQRPIGWLRCAAIDGVSIHEVP
jgi:Protein of unknown function (DUF3142)